MNRQDLFSTVTRGNEHATNFLMDMVGVLHVWDDLIDRDKPVPPEAVNAAFETMLVSIPNNPFYRQNFSALNPVLVCAINNWHVANILEQGECEEDLRIAFISRSSYIDLITQVAYIVGGGDWVREIGPHIRRFAHSEGWDGYQRNLKAEKSARESAIKGD